MQFNKDLNGQGFSTREGRYRGRCVVCGVVVVLSTSRVEQFERGQNNDKKDILKSQKTMKKS